MTIANFGQISENPLARLALLCEWTFSTSLYFRNCNRIADIKTQWCSYGTKHKSVPDPLLALVCLETEITRRITCGSRRRQAGMGSRERQRNRSRSRSARARNSRSRSGGRSGRDGARARSPRSPRRESPRRVSGRDCGGPMHMRRNIAQPHAETNQLLDL